MNKTLIFASGLALVATLAACQKKAEPSSPASQASDMPGTMADMPMPSAMKHGLAAGTVTAIDAAKGKITLDHGPMSGLSWPAMTMGFTATAEQLAGIKVGDQVDFEIDWDGRAGTITTIRQQKRD